MFRPRLLLSTSSRLFSLSAKTNKSYTPPKNVIVPNPPFAIDHSVVSSKMVMDKIKEEQQLRLGSDGRAALFARSNKHRLMPGDLVLVESLHSLSGQPLTGVASRDRITATATVSRFVGVCLSINRHGHDSNILLRNIIAGTGVEMRIPIYSPLVKSIRVVARAQKVRQARPYYLREKITKGYDLRKYLQNVGHRDPFWAPHVESVGSKGNSK